MPGKPTIEELERRIRDLEEEIRICREKEARARQDEEQFRLMFENAPLPYQSLNETDHFLDVNRKWLETMGYEKHEVIGRWFGDFLSSKDVTHFDRNSPIFKHACIINGVAFEMIKKDGQAIDVYFNGRVQLDSKNQFVRTHCIFTDNSDRKQAEKELRHAHDLMKYVVEHNRSSIAIHDRDLNYLYVSQRYLEEYKVTDKNIIGKHHYEVFPDLPQKWRDVHQKVLAGEVLSADNDPYEREDGSVDWNRWECRPWYEADGSIGGIIIYAEVINEQKRREEELKKSYKYYRTLFNRANEGLFLMTLDGKLREVNQAFADMHGYSIDELKKMDIRDLDIHKEKVFQKGVDFNRRLKAGEVIRFEVEHYHKKGHIIALNVTASLIEIGGETYCLAFHQDVTERKQLESRLLQAQKLESIGTLAGGIAHDFNNLLFPIQGLSEMLLGTLPEGSHEYENAMGIYGASQRAGELVKQILSFSRQTEHQKTPVRIQQLLKEVVKLSRSTIPSNIEIHTDIQKNCGLVMADSVQIHQIAMNLITNAYHATEDNGGRIAISLAELKLSKKEAIAPLLPGRYAVLTVSDTGNGIDPAVMNRIFEPYFTTKPKGKGTGLGLSMIYGIVKEHGGHIEVSSQLGKGSQFVVYLPLMDIPSEKKRVVMPDEITGGSERILLVDDEEMVAKLEALILKNLGYDVTMYTSSTDALAAFRSEPNRFDLVISDMTMPNMTGDKLAVELLSIRPGLPIIICTGFSEKMNMEKADTIGIKGLLFKPALKTEMAKKIREVLDSTAG